MFDAVGCPGDRFEPLLLNRAAINDTFAKGPVFIVFLGSTTLRTPAIP
jgi:hypothetical protein